MRSLLRSGPGRFVPAGVVTVLALSVGVLALTVTTRPVRLDAAAPTDRERLDVAPGAVALAFSARPDPERSHVTVVDAAGTAVTSSPASITGSTVTQPVSIRTPGTYRVGYHVAFANSRELTGQLIFTVDSPGARDRPPTPLSDGVHAHRADPVTIGVLAVDLLAVLVGLGLMLRRTSMRRSKRAI